MDAHAAAPLAQADQLAPPRVRDHTDFHDANGADRRHAHDVRSAPDPREGAAALAAALGTLDAVLGAAVETQARVLGAASLQDPWRGMHLERADVERLLAPTQHAALAAAGTARVLAAAARAVPRLEQLALRHGLDDIDLATFLVALAPDIDLKYERLYGYLHDDLTRKRATPDLAANLLAFDSAQRLGVLARLDDRAPLAASGLLERRCAPELPRLAQPLVVGAPWLDWLLGRRGLDPALAGCARLHTTAAHRHGQPVVDARDRLGRDVFARRTPVLLSGPHGAGKFAWAEALASSHGADLLVVDARDWVAAADVRAQMQRVWCTAELHGLMVFLHGVASLAQRDPQLQRALMECLAVARAPCVVASVALLAPVAGIAFEATRVALAFPPAAQRADTWRRTLAARARAADPRAVDQVAARFTLGSGQIQQAAIDASTAAPDAELLTYDELAAAARAQCGAALAGLAQRVTPQVRLDMLVVPAETRDQLHEICVRVTARESVRATWGAGCVHARSAGVTALFVGPPGTGKTLAAEAIAHDLGFDLYRIDLASVVSKYIGETERNLDRVFAAAEHGNAVLFFDEADALFGRRSEVKDAHDRYANIEIAYLLQKMESFDGLAVLATNLRQNLDEAFARRLTFSVHFPFPELAQRRLLWRALWPPHAPRGDDVDLEWFACEFRLSGGHIRNAIIAAVFLGAAAGQPITHAQLLHATRREYQKLGKNVSAASRAAQGAQP